jgi:peptidyl-tRNA hydrolase ICT1
MSAPLLRVRTIACGLCRHPLLQELHLPLQRHLHLQCGCSPLRNFGSNSSSGGGGGGGGKKTGGAGSGNGLPMTISPPYVELPLHRMQLSYTRSSGPGGQNVNKVNTRAEVRFHVPSADWLDAGARARLAEQQRGRMNQAGEFIVTAQEHRTQERNRAEALDKVRTAVAEAMVEPKQRQLRMGISKHTKEVRKDDKRHRSKVKDGRKKVKDW